MTELIEAFLTNGVISFNNGDEGAEEVNEYRDGVNYITPAREVVAPSYTVEFKVESRFSAGEGEIRPYITIPVPVALSSKGATFGDIEDKAASEIVPILRMIADALEEQIANYASSSKDAAEQP